MEQVVYDLYLEMREDDMAKDEAKPLTPYERFLAATKAIVSVPKKDVEKDIRALRKKRKRR
jgi:hypothetical protein